MSLKTVLCSRGRTGEMQILAGDWIWPMLHCCFSSPCNDISDNRWAKHLKKGKFICLTIYRQRNFLLVDLDLLTVTWKNIETMLHQLSRIKVFSKFSGWLWLIRSVLWASTFSVWILVEIVIFLVYYTIPFGFSFLCTFGSIFFF